MTEKKIDAMHREYGTFTGAKCKACPHLDAYGNAAGTRYWYKCHLYGVSSGQGTDWRAGYEACGGITIDPEEAVEKGLYGAVFRRVMCKAPEICEGQIRMEMAVKWE